MSAWLADHLASIDAGFGFTRTEFAGCGALGVLGEKCNAHFAESYGDGKTVLWHADRTERGTAMWRIS